LFQVVLLPWLDFSSQGLFLLPGVNDHRLIQPLYDVTMALLQTLECG